MAPTIAPNQPPKFADSPIEQPTLGAGGWSSVVFSTTISAAPATCLEIILDTTGYGWNKWIPRAVETKAFSGDKSTIPSPLAHLVSKPGCILPGTEFYFEVHMNPDSESFRRVDLVMTVMEQFERDGRKGIRVAWKSLGDPWYLKAERTQEFLETAEGGTEYVNYETFFGPVAPAIYWATGTSLLNGLALYMNGLKDRAEAKESGSRA